MEDNAHDNSEKLIENVRRINEIIYQRDELAAALRYITTSRLNGAQAREVAEAALKKIQQTHEGETK